MVVRFLLTLLLLTTGIADASAHASPGATGEREWLAAGDFHLDPFDRSTEPAQPGSDANPVLFAEAIARMKRAVPDPAVVLLPGDFFVHDFPRVAARGDASATLDEAAVRTMKLIAESFDRAFPRAQFAIVLGNNDAPCGDYHSDAGGAYLSAVARVWAPLVNRRGAAPQFAASFARDGYYTATLPVRGMRLVALDTVLLSNQYSGPCAGANANGARQELAWLDATLRDTRPGTRNLVMMHVRPAMTRSPRRRCSRLPPAASGSIPASCATRSRR